MKLTPMKHSKHFLWPDWAGLDADMLDPVYDLANAISGLGLDPSRSLYLALGYLNCSSSTEDESGC